MGFDGLLDLKVRVNFVEVRDDSDPIQQQQDKEGFLKALKDLTSFRKKNRDKGKAVSSDGQNRGLADPKEEDGGDQKQLGKLLSKKRRLSFSFRYSKGKVEPWSEKTNTAVNDGVSVDRQQHDTEPTAPISTTSQTVCPLEIKLCFSLFDSETVRKTYSYPLTCSTVIL